MAGPGAGPGPSASSSARWRRGSWARPACWLPWSPTEEAPPCGGSRPPCWPPPSASSVITWRSPRAAPLSRPGGPREAGAPVPLPLRGIHVVEATTLVQGPLAGRLLQMLGADVTRVEPPGGDPARAVPPAAGADGATFVAYNDGKRAVEIDYKT